MGGQGLDGVGEEGVDGGGVGVMVTLWGGCTTFSENLSISLVSATGGLSAIDSGV